MPEFKERPKMDKPKARHPNAIHPKQAARLMKEKYARELDQRREGAESESTYAVDQVEGTSCWAVDEAVAHRPRRQPSKNPLKERRHIEGKTDPAQGSTTPTDPQKPKQRPADRPKEREAITPKTKRQTQQKVVNSPNGQDKAQTQRKAVNAIKERKAATIKERTAQAEPKPIQPQGQAVPGVEYKKATLAKARRGQAQGQRPTVKSPETISAPLGRGLASGAPTGNTTPKGKPRHSGAFRERPHTAFKTRSSLPATKSKTPPTKVKPPAVRSAKKAARQTAQRQMTQRMIAQAQKAAKATMTATKKAAEAAVRAVAAMISGLAGLLGGGVLLALLLLVAIVAAVASSPFGIFFAEDGDGGGGSTQPTVSVAEAVAQVNMAYNSTLEGLQAGTYDSIDVTGSAPEWPDVLAVFAARYAGDENGVDVATLDADRVSKLTATFWDMTDITSTVETIDHPDSDPDDDTDDSWTEYILHIAITAKTAGDMETTYGFTDYQKDAMAELLADRAALSSLAGSLDISNVDALAVLKALPADLSLDRREVVRAAMTLCGKVNYFWGGKSHVIGWDSRWGQLKKVTAAGSTTTGTFRPYGLDCSGFADWVFYNASGGAYILGHGGGAHSQHGYCTAITWDEAMPGDLAFYPEDEHIGIVCGRDESGGPLIIHCASSANNVVITGISGFTSVGRPIYYGE